MRGRSLKLAPNFLPEALGIGAVITDLGKCRKTELRALILIWDSKDLDTAPEGSFRVHRSRQEGVATFQNEYNGAGSPVGGGG